MLNPIELLKDDHQKVKKLFEQLADTSNQAEKTREKLFTTIEMELTVHTTIEEEILYPALRKAAKNDEQCRLYFEAVEEHSMLQLRARAWPTGEARIVIRCEAQGDGTLVTMEEWASSGPAAKLPQSLLDPPLHARNVEALKRLAYLAESRARRHDDSGGHGGVPRLRRPGSAGDPRDEA